MLTARVLGSIAERPASPSWRQRRRAHATTTPITLLAGTDHRELQAGSTSARPRGCRRRAAPPA
ncbi:MAG: hypothetical protein R2713_13090 [Ilumatobacteraceae bacterium]